MPTSNVVGNTQVNKFGLLHNSNCLLDDLNELRGDIGSQCLKSEASELTHHAKFVSYSNHYKVYCL